MAALGGLNPRGTSSATEIAIGMQASRTLDKSAKQRGDEQHLDALVGEIESKARTTADFPLRTVMR